MSLLKIGLPGLSLPSEVEVGNKFLMNKVPISASSIKAVRHAVHEYDKKIPLSINVLKRRMMLSIIIATNTRRNETNDNTERINKNM